MYIQIRWLHFLILKVCTNVAAKLAKIFNQFVNIGHPISGEKQAIVVYRPAMETCCLGQGANEVSPDTDTAESDTDEVFRTEEIKAKQSLPLRKL